MNKPITIHKLSKQLGLTSRPLHHWEAERINDLITEKQLIQFLAFLHEQKSHIITEENEF